MTKKYMIQKSDNKIGKFWNRKKSSSRRTGPMLSKLKRWKNQNVNSNNILLLKYVLIFDSFLVSGWLTLIVVFDSLINAVPVPEIKTNSEQDLRNIPPKEVQALNRWICPYCKHYFLKDFLEIDSIIKRMKKNTKNILSMYLLN